MADAAHPFHNRTLTSWQDQFQSSLQPEERYQALQAILTLSTDNEIVPWMLRALHDADSSLRAAASRWFAHQAEKSQSSGKNEIWPSVLPIWETMLGDSDPDVRFESARGILARNAEHDRATDVLLEFLNDPETQPVMLPAVLHALSLGTGPAENHNVVWEKLCEHDRSDVREQTARTLGRWGARWAEWLPQLIALLDDEEPFVREEAARAIGALGTATEAVMSALNAAVLDDDAIVSEAAQTSLRKLIESH